MTKTERISKAEYWLSMAELVSQRSSCDRLHVGAVLVRDDIIISTGRNGTPIGQPHCHHDIHTPCTESVHAEANAIVFAGRPLAKGATMYLTHSPCFPCAGLIIQAGVVEVIFRHVYRDQAGIERLFNAGVIPCSMPKESHV